MFAWCFHFSIQHSWFKFKGLVYRKLLLAVGYLELLLLLQEEEEVRSCNVYKITSSFFLILQDEHWECLHIIKFHCFQFQCLVSREVQLLKQLCSTTSVTSWNTLLSHFNPPPPSTTKLLQCCTLLLHLIWEHLVP